MFVKLATVAVDRVLDQTGFERRQADRRLVEYDPSYVFVVVRAVTADRPNNNGDCFPNDELMRVDAQNKRPVWASFIGKGVYVNHKNTDDPTQAKGIILDARYVTANAEDKYIELLLGVDRKKDPIFARDVERGIINKFSMGASVQRTICSVCKNEAKTEKEFCEHIAKHKMKEVAASDGKKSLAYELCYGVTYNEVSAVSDPADESAETLARIASREPGVALESIETVNVLKEVSSSVQRIEEALMRKGIVKRADEPAETPGEEAEEPKKEEQAEASGEMVLVHEVLEVVMDLVDKKIPPAEAVEQLADLTEGLEPEMEEKPMSVDVNAPVMASRKEVIRAIRERLAARRAAKAKTAEEPAKPAAAPAAATTETPAATPVETPAAATTATASEKGKTAAEAKPADPPFKGQYPKYTVQKDPKQHHTKPLKGRPASDFAKDKKDYSKFYGYTAAFIPNDGDIRKSAWYVENEGKGVFMITGASAWGDQIRENYSDFASEEYGNLLIKTIASEGPDVAMDMAGGLPVPETLVKEVATAAPAPETEGILAAAERKAEAMAEERVAAFKERFFAGIRMATELQDKNVLDNPIRAVAYEILQEEGADPNLVERLASGPVVQAHIDEAVRKALEYTEMTPESFEELKAHVSTMPAVKLASTAEVDPENREEAERLAMRRRASFNGGYISPVPGNSLRTTMVGVDEPLRRAIRGGGSQAVRTAIALTR